jgi:hypothetical protein
MTITIMDKEPTIKTIRENMETTTTKKIKINMETIKTITIEKTTKINIPILEKEQDIGKIIIKITTTLQVNFNKFHISLQFLFNKSKK